MVGFRGKDKDDGNEQQFVFQVSLCSSFFEKKKDDQPVGGIFFPKPRLQKTSLPPKKNG